MGGSTGTALPWVVPSVSILAAVLVSIANYSIQRWRFIIDRLGMSIDQICGEINLSADLACDYWQIDCKERGDDQRLASNLEPRLIGRQMRIQNLLVSLKQQDPKLDFTEIDIYIANLYSSMTGGTFQTVGRAADQRCGRDVQSNAASLNGAFRRALVKRMRNWR